MEPKKEKCRNAWDSEQGLLSPKFEKKFDILGWFEYVTCHAAQVHAKARHS
jgi:hypothetical protein